MRKLGVAIVGLCLLLCLSLIMPTSAIAASRHQYRDTIDDISATGGALQDAEGGLNAARRMANSFGGCNASPYAVSATASCANLLVLFAPVIAALGVMALKRKK